MRLLLYPLGVAAASYNPRHISIRARTDSRKGILTCLSGGHL